MTAVPTDARFTPEQSARLAEIEAAPDAEESLRERVITALVPFMPPISIRLRRAMANDAADAVLAVLRPAVVGDRAEGQ